MIQQTKLFKALSLITFISLSSMSFAKLIIEEDEVKAPVVQKQSTSVEKNTNPKNMSSIKAQVLPTVKSQTSNTKTTKPVQNLMEEKTVTLKEDSSFFNWFKKDDKQNLVASKAQETISGKTVESEQKKPEEPKQIEKRKKKLSNKKFASRIATEQDLKNLDKGYVFSNNEKLLERSKRIAKQSAKANKKIKNEKVSSVAQVQQVKKEKIKDKKSIEKTKPIVKEIKQSVEKPNGNLNDIFKRIDKIREKETFNINF